MRNILLITMILLGAIITKASDFQVAGIHYKVVSLQDLTVEVTYPNLKSPDIFEPSTYSGKITIPSTVQFKGRDFRVIGIGKNAFSHSKITDITISKGLKYINEYAFDHVETLSSANIPAGVEILQSSAFAGCRFKTFNIPASCTYIGADGIPAFVNEFQIEDSDTPITLQYCRIIADNLYIGRTVNFNDSSWRVKNSISFGNKVPNINNFLQNIRCGSDLIVNIHQNTPPPMMKEITKDQAIHILLRVPSQAIEEYKQAYWWKEIFSIEPIKE